MIKDLKDITREEVKLFGGKATNLGFLIQNGFNVPAGFCISTKINKLTKDIKKNIIQNYKGLDSPVSVRSSATAEDARNASFAGQFDTFLNINSEAKLLDAIKDCWNSVKSSRVNSYLEDKTIKNLDMAVIVQKMVNADFAGVIFTVNPIKKKGILIEVTEGLGDKLVSGEVTPNTYFIDKKSLKILNDVKKFDFTTSLVKKLSQTALAIEKLYRFPQDIEFCIKNEKIFILQSRPITTL